ncbi:transmembrane protein 242 [Orussus abietinus]|uniref:transmembrane protein 242 n=1 Tax=Orussus abietinus TaxID=222816 RepID=UPI0006250038|nr:transmembrane protein 242 [Orussus abietinus]XP_012272629.1 transmembrane protein 242 [Orussus abietinus]XP_012272630.1 transmembrane protein 242 [Orussus abietinus]
MATGLNTVVSENIDTNSLKNGQMTTAEDTEKKKYNFRATIFLTAVAGMSTIIGFGAALGAVKKQDPKGFSEGIVGAKGMAETGSSLALRALGWGTLYAVSGCSIFFYAIWKLSGATNAAEFRLKMGSLLPTIPKNDPPQSRIEFEGLTDLLKYVSEDWGKENTPTTK